MLYIFFGLIATGKSTLARAWAEHLGINWYNSDVLRKELAGLTGTRGGQGFRQGIYTEEYTARTYQALADKAAEELGQGRSVVLDASYRSQSLRQAVRNLAKKHGALARFILCSCAEAELRRRLEERARDPEAVSDGRWEIYLRQKEVFEAPDELAADELITIDTKAPQASLVGQLARALDEKQ